MYIRPSTEHLEMLGSEDLIQAVRDKSQGGMECISWVPSAMTLTLRTTLRMVNLSASTTRGESSDVSASSSPFFSLKIT